MLYVQYDCVYVSIRLFVLLRVTNCFCCFVLYNGRDANNGIHSTSCAGASTCLKHIENAATNTPSLLRNNIIYIVLLGRPDMFVWVHTEGMSVDCICCGAVQVYEENNCATV